MRAITTLLLAGCAQLCMLAPLPAWAQGETGTLVDEVRGVIDRKTIEALFVDSAPTIVSAATLAGIDDDALNAVENVRDFSMLVKAFDSNAKGFGLTIAPARTAFPVPRINLQTYGQPDAYFTRLLGGVSISYAQGKTAYAGVEHTRRAFSLGTSAYVRAKDDPVVIVAAQTQCSQAAFDAVPLSKSVISHVTAQELVRLSKLERDAAAGKPEARNAIEEIRAKAKAGDTKAALELEAIEQAALSRRQKEGDKIAEEELARRLRGHKRESADIEKAALAAYNSCVDGLLKDHGKKWNRSRYSVSFAAGSAKPSDGSGSSVSLGRTLSASVLYGFDGVRALSERAALVITARRSSDEPVLTTLGTGAVQTQNSTLVGVRLSGGSSVFRGLIDWSNARKHDITATQRTFNRALGIDYRITDGLWLSVRYGRQRKLDGSGNETGSFLAINYGPSATLGH